jgi:serine/threonine protein phosphatase PrpC
VKYPSEDRLQKRLADLLAPAASARAVNGGESVCVGTYIGTVRKQNEDRALIVYVSYPDTPNRNFVLGVVSDGIGGLPRGDEASVITVSEFCAQFIRHSKLPIGARLLAAADSANHAVYSLLKSKGGATLSAAFIGNGQVFGVNVGDSRIYSISENRKLKQLSKDDTLAGYLTRREGEVSNPSENGLLQYIGMGQGLEPHIIIEKGNGVSSILVTSDGAHGAPEDALSEVVRVSRTNIELTNRLLTLSNILGGRDNSTALLLSTDFSSELSSQHGINIACISPFDRLEIWIPNTETLAAEDESLTTRNDAQVGATDKVADAKEPRGLTSSRKRKNRRKKGSNHDAGLPLETERPSLDISFPEKQKS